MGGGGPGGPCPPPPIHTMPPPLALHLTFEVASFIAMPCSWPLQMKVCSPPLLCLPPNKDSVTPLSRGETYGLHTWETLPFKWLKARHCEAFYNAYHPKSDLLNDSRYTRFQIPLISKVKKSWIICFRCRKSLVCTSRATFKIADSCPRGI